MYFTDSLTLGGTEQMLLTLMQGLDRTRWEPMLVHHASSELVPLLVRAHRSGIETIAVPPMRGRDGLTHTRGFLQLLRAKRPTVFHAQLTMPLACKFALATAALGRVPAVLATEHLFVDIPYRHSRWIERVVAPGIQRYIAVSEHVAKQMRAALPFTAHKLDVVHNGIPTEKFLRAAGKPVRKLPIVLTIARLTEQKGIRHLLDAAVRVPHAEFWIVGEGPDRAALRSYAAQLQIADRVKFLGQSTDVAPLLWQADLFVLPSLFEGLPVSILEAMAAGVPVIATQVGGTPEEIGSCETGLLVPPGDPAALADAICHLLTNPGLAQRLAMNAEARVRQEFSVERMVQRTTDIYDTVLATRGAK